MHASILHKVKLFRRSGPVDVWCLRGRDFTTDGTSFTVIASTITGEGEYDVVHTIKNVVSGKTSDITMPQLIKILLRSE